MRSVLEEVTRADVMVLPLKGAIHSTRPTARRRQGHQRIATYTTYLSAEHLQAARAARA